MHGNNMKIAITGGTGFLGRRFVEQVIAQGHQARVLVLPHEEKPPGQIVVGDLLHPEDIAQEFFTGIDVFVHLAAHGVQRRDRSWEKAAQINVMAPLRLLQLAKEAGVKQVVAAGTCLEYASSGLLPDAPWTEKHAPLCLENSSLESNDAYGATKAAGGIMLRTLARELALPLWYLRLASLYGPGDDPEKFLPAALNSACKGRPFEMTSGEQVREWLHLDDAVSALLKAVEQDAPKEGGLVNIGIGEGVKLKDLVLKLYQLAKADPQLIKFGARPYGVNEAHYLVMEVTLGKERLSWQAQVELDQGLAALIENMR